MNGTIIVNKSDFYKYCYFNLYIASIIKYLHWLQKLETSLMICKQQDQPQLSRYENKSQCRKYYNLIKKKAGPWHGAVVLRIS